MNYSVLDIGTATPSISFPRKERVLFVVQTALISMLVFNGGGIPSSNQELLSWNPPALHQGITDTDSAYNGSSLSFIGGRFVVDGINMKSRHKLMSFLDLEPNWDGYGAEPFSEEYIHKALGYLNQFSYNTEVFPSADGLVKFEFQRPDGAYLEIEICDDGTINGYEVRPDGSDLEFTEAESAILRIVDTFYE